ncbi:CHAT domain-containing protein [Micromonospora sp. RTGN7]|uniref:CHAT domain-containing tetratricopeptide repeat protein n=1 Tax=Micromonospora sp. RTGN7 TaxID=3016526 RepID=UPI0029FF3C60|nr:CHAT domain-containing protein [Micromonospora sp. RTGN7]
MQRHLTTSAPEPVLAPEAIGELVDLLCSVPDPLDDMPVTQAAGLLLLTQVIAAANADAVPEMTVALELLAPVYLRGYGVPDVVREQFERHPPAEPDTAPTLASLGRLLYGRTLSSPDEKTLNQAVALLTRALALAEPHHPEYARSLTNLGSMLLTRFERAGDLDDLEFAINLTEAAVDATAPGDAARGTYLSNLGNALLTRFEYLASEADLDAAIKAHQAAVTGWPDDPEHAGMRANLDLALRTRARFRDQVSELDRMIEMARTGSAAELSDLLQTRFDHAGNRVDLEEAIQVRRAALTAVVDDSERADHRSRLADLLLSRFVHLGQGEDIEDAVAHGRAAVAATPAGDPQLARHQLHLANALNRRHRTIGGLDDLEEAAALGRRAVDGTPAADPNRAAHLSSLCVALCSLAERTGRTADLDEAIEAGRTAVDTAPPHTPYRSAFLGNLGAALLARFRQTGGQADLAASLDALRRAALAAPAASPERATVLANLCGALQSSYDSLRRREDLDEAIDAGRSAVQLTPAAHPALGIRLSNLAVTLRTRFEVGADVADLDEAVDASRSAVRVLPPGHPGRPAALSNESLALSSRYEHVHRPDDLDEAVRAVRAAIGETPADHPYHTAYLLNLGQALRRRWTQTGNPADLDEAIAVSREAASAEVGPTRFRAAAAALQASLAAAAGRWTDAMTGYTAAVDLMVRTVARHITRGDREHLLDGMGGTAADAVASCVRAGAIGRGVELFEQGRGVLLSQALDSRTDLTALAERHPETAERFTALSQELDSHGPAGDTAARRTAAAAFDRLVADIRDLPEFGAFLRPPTVEQLRPDEGHAVIVTVSAFGSYAVVLPATGSLTAVALPELTPDDLLTEVLAYLHALDDIDANAARQRACGQEQLARTLGWLWDTIAGPVLDHLGITGAPVAGQRPPRLWWCPAGLLTLLPLHAAGHHDTASSAAHRTLPDRVRASTTPTLRALAHARRTGAERPRNLQGLVVAMPHTPGGNADLFGAETEAEIVEEYCPGGVAVLSGTAATREVVLAALAEAHWAHFACHGYTDLDDPSSSRLLLADHHDRPLTVVDVAGLRLDGGELAYLSACSTAQTGARLHDEVIHLASAFQLAGFRHVVGTLWPVGDRHAVDFAELVYAALADGADIATAVHDAARRMRDRWPDTPSVWASHIHIGP